MFSLNRAPPYQYGKLRLKRLAPVVSINRSLILPYVNRDFNLKFRLVSTEAPSDGGNTSQFLHDSFLKSPEQMAHYEALI